MAARGRAVAAGGGGVEPKISRGNIPPTTRFLKSMGLLVMTWAIVAVLIMVAVRITPSLIELGR